jgi:regulator of replication initiation timing
MAKQALARTVDLEPIDRLEEKIKLLVEMVGKLREEQARSIEDNTRLVQEVESLRSRVAEAELAGSELTTLRDERELIRTRVADMLAQLDIV